MEPEGFEPSCRSSQRKASTRVFDDLISTSEPPSTAFHRPSLRCFSLVQPGDAAAQASPMSSARPLSDVADEPWRLISGGHCQLRSGSYCGACFLRGPHAPRRATLRLPCPVDYRIGPRCQRSQTARDTTPGKAQAFISPLRAGVAPRHRGRVRATCHARGARAHRGVSSTAQGAVSGARWPDVRWLILAGCSVLLGT